MKRFGTRCRESGSECRLGEGVLEFVHACHRTAASDTRRDGKETEETRAHSRECSKGFEYWQVTQVWFCATLWWSYRARQGFGFCAAGEFARLARLWGTRREGGFWRRLLVQRQGHLFGRGFARACGRG